MEAWRPVVGYEGLYSVSDLGNVRGEARLVPHLRAGKMLRQRPVRARINKATKYPAVNLSREGKRRTFTVHALVAAAFLGPRPDGMEVAHGDGDRGRSVLSNLRYATPTANHADKVEHGTLLCGEQLPQAKLTVEKVRSIRADGRLQREIAAEHGVSVPTISQAQSGRSWAHV